MQKHDFRDGQGPVPAYQHKRGGPKCGRIMCIGAPHADGDAYQWECHCGKIIRVGKGE